MRYEFIESPIFSSYLSDYLTDDEYAELQEYLNICAMIQRPAR